MAHNDNKMNTAHDRMAPTCGYTFWVDPRKGGKVVPANHPGAIEITCGKCQRCLITKRNLHVGRMISEQHHSVASVMLTLTFADINDVPVCPDALDPRAAQSPEELKAKKAEWKQYWDTVREYWVPFRKSLWKRYGQTQYCGAAELGDKRGRLHFHMGIYFGKDNKVPEWVHLPSNVERDFRLATRSGLVDADGCFTSCGVKVQRQYSVKGRKDEFVCWLPEWKHGYVHIGQMTPATAGYIAKYIMKPSDAAKLRGPASAHNSYATKVFRSHKLGYRYMRDLGERAAAAGLPMRNRYRLDGQTYASGPRMGQSREYPMTRGMRREAGRAYLRTVAKMLALHGVKSWRAVGDLSDGGIAPEVVRLVSTSRKPRKNTGRVLARTFMRARLGRVFVRTHKAQLKEISKAIRSAKSLPTWRAAADPDQGFVLADVLEDDARRDPRFALESFFFKLRKEKRGQWSVPRLDLGTILHAVSTPDGGVVSKTITDEYVFTWPDLSGHGRDFHIPILNRGELVRAVRRGGVEAFGLYPPDVRLVVREAVPMMRRRGQLLGEVAPDGVVKNKLVDAEPLGTPLWPIRQTLEHRGVGVSDHTARWAAIAAGAGPLKLKAVRAYASDAQLEAIRRRIVDAWGVRWNPSAVRMAGLGVGIPLRWSATAPPSDLDRAKYPYFVKLLEEVIPMPRSSERRRNRLNKDLNAKFLAQSASLDAGESVLDCDCPVCAVMARGGSLPEILTAMYELSESSGGQFYSDLDDFDQEEGQPAFASSA